MNNNTKMLAMNAIIAGLYAVVTMALSPISYGAVQFRLSEIMILLVLFNPRYIVGLTIGCLIANLNSPFGMPDVIFGTLATGLALYSMTKIKNIYISSLMPTIFNAIIIGFELWYFAKLPLLSSIVFVGIGEFVVVTLIGIPVYKLLIKNPKIRELLS